MKDGYYTIRTWEDMKEEFGLDHRGSITVPRTFTKEMEEDLPEDRSIYIKDDEWNGWSFSNEMIECPKDKSTPNLKEGPEVLDLTTPRIISEDILVLAGTGAKVVPAYLHAITENEVFILWNLMDGKPRTAAAYGFDSSNTWSSLNIYPFTSKVIRAIVTPDQEKQLKELGIEFEEVSE